MTNHRCDTSYFDRTLCPEPCDTMHSYCTTCGKRQGPCPHDGSDHEDDDYPTDNPWMNQADVHPFGYADPEANKEIQRLRAEIQVQGSIVFSTYEGFRGCTDRDPDHCACATHQDPECEGCGETVEDGEAIVTVTRLALPTVADTPDNWWDYHTAHRRCSAFTPTKDAQ